MTGGLAALWVCGCNRHRHHRIVAQLVVVVEILVAQRDHKYPLPDQRLGHGRLRRSECQGCSAQAGAQQRARCQSQAIGLQPLRDAQSPCASRRMTGTMTNDGNHLETWNRLRTLLQHPHFIYVTDCKLCTEKNLRTSEVATFTDAVLAGDVRWEEILRKRADRSQAHAGAQNGCCDPQARRCEHLPARCRGVDHGRVQVGCGAAPACDHQRGNNCAIGGHGRDLPATTALLDAPPSDRCEKERLTVFCVHREPPRRSLATNRYFPVCDCMAFWICSLTASKLKLALFCIGGNSIAVCASFPTSCCANWKRQNS
jgi:hypothetical protein